MVRFQPVCKICNQVRWCGDLLQTSLCALYFELQAKGIISGTLFRLATYGILTHIHCPCLQLMSLWSSRLEWSLLLLITQVGKVSKLVTSFTLKFLHRALKAFHMDWISTLWASFLALVHILRVKDLLVMTWHLGILITRILLTWLSWLDKRLLLLVFSWWKFCALVPHKIDLHSLWVTSHLFDMVHSCLGTFHSLCKLPDLACWEFF